MEVLPISKQELQINEQIRDKELRVIDTDGTQLGIMSLRQALEIAEQKNLENPLTGAAEEDIIISR